MNERQRLARRSCEFIINRYKHLHIYDKGTISI